MSWPTKRPFSPSFGLWSARVWGNQSLRKMRTDGPSDSVGWPRRWSVCLNVKRLYRVCRMIMARKLSNTTGLVTLKGPWIVGVWLAKRMAGIFASRDQIVKRGNSRVCASLRGQEIATVHSGWDDTAGDSTCATKTGKFPACDCSIKEFKKCHIIRGGHPNLGFCILPPKVASDTST